MIYSPRVFLLSVVAIGSLAAAASTAPANAGGFLGDVVGIVNPQLGRALDRGHEMLGKPLDTPIGQPAQAPGPALPPGAPMPGPAMMPIPVGGAPLGGFCMVAGAGVFGPGPLMPIGSGCQAATPYGLQFGQVIR